MNTKIPDLAELAPLGKHTASASYFHSTAIPLLPDEIVKLLYRAANLADAPPEKFDVIKINARSGAISFLAYPKFFDDGFPCLERAKTVHLDSKRVLERDYSTVANPPILHRKELLLPLEHPARVQFSQLTKNAADLGLFEGGGNIGRLLAWQGRLARAGWESIGNTIRPAGVGETSSNRDQIQRHRTALTRYALSSPMQTLWQLGVIKENTNVFDYGCGRGDDVRILEELGVQASGWDPYFAPDNPKTQAEIVNLGFVLNVIEDRKERFEALEKAWALAGKLLIVSCIVAGSTQFERHRVHRDGVLTRRGTFQKFFTQPELRNYLEDNLGAEAIPAGPGSFILFRDPELQEELLARGMFKRRSRGRARLQQLPPELRKKIRREIKWAENEELVEEFWKTALELARLPDPDEFGRWGELKTKVGNPRRVLEQKRDEDSQRIFEHRRAEREADLLLYLALSKFERKKTFSDLPASIQRDMRDFWGSFKAAQSAALEQLLSAGDGEKVIDACISSSGTVPSLVEPGEGFWIRPEDIHELPTTLRILAGCAERIYGSLERADLCKFHFQSRKLSLLSYAEFETEPFPRLLERTKILLAQNDFLEIDHSDADPPWVLTRKSAFLREEDPEKQDQAAAEARVQKPNSPTQRLHERVSTEASPAPEITEELRSLLL